MAAPVLPRVTLRVGGARGHLFFFRKMVAKPEVAIEPGALVEVFDRSGSPVGRGFYNPRSNIALRMLSFESSDADADAFVGARLQAAIALRHDVLRLPEVTDAYRVCHAEGDGLSGLMVDRFGPVISVELFSRGWFVRRGALRQALAACFPDARVFLQADQQAQVLEGFQLPNDPIPPPVEIREHGARFRVDFAKGHKTGFFCDQRENRAAVAALARGRAVADLCCYTGGFAIQAARAGARRVTGVDLDEDALATARDNARLNDVTIDYRHANVFDFLKHAPQPSGVDFVVLDPPKLARTREDLPKARRTYFDMNQLAMRALPPGGLLVSCSCSGLIHEPEFLELVRGAAQAAGRELRVFRVAGAGADHPVSSLYPEGRYLKAVFGVLA